MDEADPRAKLEPFQALIGQWTIEMTHPMVEAGPSDTTSRRSPMAGSGYSDQKSAPVKRCTFCSRESAFTRVCRSAVSI
jgi:hypothetical protein